MAGIDTGLLDKVKDPFTFLVLILLMVEAVLGGMAYSFEPYRDILIPAIIAFLAVYTILVFYLVIREPSPISSNFAKELGNDIYVALQGPFSNLEDVEAEEAWATLAEVVKNGEATEADRFLAFRKTVSERLEKNAQILGNWKPLQHQNG
ncbi:hypothetical protein QWI17_18185 [Gilvimarinus sp. SDUM040013]|uniref:Uncharacterized protein n=1 Tax=Gilvimarinus gilvus TaxID=3058038 RepID=A0ABU4S6L2_9GAMM|nr:hypothetical protein [Gilvimarinus sp. SDUM040013]MDO3387778.1 hypothetical protein [Gilvimarinus sp. SDUM040013]MDX6851553.1 hypothetical protein [Gilvimarinus sp. SDUM040013]